MSDIFSEPAFETAFTYDGDDLGAAYTPEATHFRLWAPTACAAQVLFYRSGNAGTDDRIGVLEMQPDRFGTWLARAAGDWSGVYYTYCVRLGEHSVEACDPYARAVGVNGLRSMVIDLAATNPEGWDCDTDPHANCPPADAVIYEAHIRDLSADRSSGIRRRGKFLGVCEHGTHTPAGVPTGLDHILGLGVTHLHLLPIFDFGSIDERRPHSRRYNWGYDPVNFNVPEGSYSSDPFCGETRIRELKRMIQSLHESGLSVIMDVVYNHVYDAERFCFNVLVPAYFTRITDGIYSNGSGCGNDTAPERSMIRKYIVDSVCYWMDEYHIDGFRFDLAGLLDTVTVNAIVSKIRLRHPNAILYGEGWSLDTRPVKPCVLATQRNSALTPGFAYFNDVIRDTLRGPIFESSAPGFVTGAEGLTGTLAECFRGMPAWCGDPAQCINYVSCHDDYTLFDRIALSCPGESAAMLARRNRLAAAFCLTAQGIPFLQAGEEFLRSKPDRGGSFLSNSYRSPDRVNSLKWETLALDPQRITCEYYRGLIALRRAHPVLRAAGRCEITPVPIDSRAIAFFLRGAGEELFLVFSAAPVSLSVALPDGQWQLCVDAERAGTSSLGAFSGIADVPPIGAMVFLRTV